MFLLIDSLSLCDSKVISFYLFIFDSKIILVGEW